MTLLFDDYHYCYFFISFKNLKISKFTIEGIWSIGQWPPPGRVTNSSTQSYSAYFLPSVIGSLMIMMIHVIIIIIIMMMIVIIILIIITIMTITMIMIIEIVIIKIIMMMIVPWVILSP